MFWKKKKSSENCMTIVEMSGKIYAQIARGKKGAVNNEFEMDCTIREILDWGRKNKAGSTIWLMPADIYEIHPDLSEEAEPEEVMQALAYELSSLSGAATDSIRPSVVMTSSKGLYRGGYCSAIPVTKLKELEKECRRAKIKNHGIMSLQQALLLDYLYYQTKENSHILLLLNNCGFLAGMSGTSCSIRNIPFGLPGKNLTEEQWKQKISRRVGNLAGQKLRLYLETLSETTLKSLEELIELESLDAFAPKDLWEILPGLSGEATAKQLLTATPPPKVKDPRETGTKLCLFMIGASLAVMIFQYAQLKATDSGLSKNYKNKKNLSDALKSNEKQLADLRNKISYYHVLTNLLKTNHAVSNDFINFIKLLHRYRLKYTKITSICQQSNGIIITGETYWQPDMAGFLSHFEKQLGRHNQALFSEGLSNKEDGRLEFKCRISKGADKHR